MKLIIIFVHNLLGSFMAQKTLVQMKITVVSTWMRLSLSFPPHTPLSSFHYVRTILIETFFSIFRDPQQFM